MTVHIGKITTEAVAYDGDLPFSERQVQALVSRVIQCLGEKHRAAEQAAEATVLRSGASPTLQIEP